jgi:hypothetical protein
VKSERQEIWVTTVKLIEGIRLAVTTVESFVQGVDRVSCK